MFASSNNCAADESLAFSEASWIKMPRVVNELPGSEDVLISASGMEQCIHQGFMQNIDITISHTDGNGT